MNCLLILISDVDAMDRKRKTEGVRFCWQLTLELPAFAILIDWGSLHSTAQRNKKFWEELISYFPWHDTGHIENDASNNSSIVACVFFTAVTFLPTRCLATIRGFLPSRCLATVRGFLPSRCLSTIRGFLRSRCLSTIRGFLPSRCLTTIKGLLPSRFLAMIGKDTLTHTHTQTATWSHKPTFIFFFKMRK
jgi:hypothetical protein